MWILFVSTLELQSSTPESFSAYSRDLGVAYVGRVKKCNPSGIYIKP